MNQNYKISSSNTNNSPILFKNNYISNLPNELIKLIFEFFNFQEKLFFGINISKQWRNEIMGDNNYWLNNYAKNLLSFDFQSEENKKIILTNNNFENQKNQNYENEEFVPICEALKFYKGNFI